MPVRVPSLSSNVNMLNDIFRTSDEDTRDEEEDQDANLRKLSSGLTIRPVDSSEEPKPKYVK